MNWAWLTFIILFIYASIVWVMLDKTPIGERVAEIRLIPGNEPLIVGYAELGQRPGEGSAVADHLQVRQDKNGWWIANISGQRRVDAPTEIHKTRYLRRWVLASGDRITLDNVAVEVLEASSEQLRLKGPTGVASWVNGSLIQNPPPFDCHRDEGDDWWRHYFNYTQELHLFTIGGQVPCARRWLMPGVHTKGAEVLWRDGKYWLAPGQAEVRFARAGEINWHNFSDVEWKLDDSTELTSKLVLGRTHYHLSWDQSTLTLIPIDGGDIWPQNSIAKRPIPRDSRVQVRWEPVTLAVGAWSPLRWLYRQWLWLIATLGISLLGSIAILQWPAPDPYALPRSVRLIVIVPALTLGVLTMATIWTDPVPPVSLLLSLGLAWGWCSVLLLVVDRLRGSVGLLWSVALGLILFGSLVQGQLGLGGNSTHWLEFAMGHWRTLACVGWAIVPLTLVQRSSWENLATALIIDPEAPLLWQRVRLSLPWIAVIALGLQAVLGSEQGIFGTQPVEGVKTLTALLSAYVGQRIFARRAGLGQYHLDAPLRSNLELMWSFLLFLLSVLLLLRAVQDLSPLLILVLLGLPMVWHLAPHPLRGTEDRVVRNVRRLVILLVMALIGVLCWIQAWPETVPHNMFQYDRLMVWAQPALFNASGYQVHLAQTFAAAGGLTGVQDGPFGWNGSVMNLPVIQNDFIGAFLLNRLGSAGGIFMLCIQLSYVAILLSISHTVYEWGQLGDDKHKETGVFLSLALFALAWLFLAHTLIAWGNVLGLLPVMGQPMTFIAAGTSHLLLFAIPTLILGLTAGWLTLPSPQHS